MMKSDTNLGIAPATRPLRNQISSDLRMKLKDQLRAQRLGCEATLGNGVFDPENPFRKKRGQLRVTQEALCGFDETGGAAWRCSVSSYIWSTGSFSKAMENATWRGILRQRICC